MNPTKQARRKVHKVEPIEIGREKRFWSEVVTFAYTPICNPSWLKWQGTLEWDSVTCASCLAKRPKRKSGGR